MKISILYGGKDLKSQKIFLFYLFVLYLTLSPRKYLVYAEM